jgi:hypothetical protein
MLKESKAFSVFLVDDAGTPFTVIVIPVDHKLAIKAQP